VTKVRGWNIKDCPEEDVRRLMFVHIIATLGCSPVVTDEDMDYPKNWLNILHGIEKSPSELVGHRPDGRTVCIHSIAVCPRLQGLGLGTATLKSYVQRMNSSGLADRVALICRKSEIRFFQKCGFRNIGRSDTKTLTGEFYNMVRCYSTSMQSTPALYPFRQPIFICISY
jgi:GNAT superfamily N-acetyltransferase